MFSTSEYSGIVSPSLADRVDQELESMRELTTQLRECLYFDRRSTKEDFEKTYTEKIKVHTVSRKEFKRLERVSIMNEWELLVLSDYK